MALFVDIEKKLGSFFLKAALEADEGVTSLLGASGCGKSMTLKMIAGIEKPDKGRIILNGRVLFDSEKNINLPPQKRRVGYLFQQYALFPNMTVRQNIKTGLRAIKGKEDTVDEILKVMRLEKQQRLYPYQLSGGQQQRCALARILVNEPELILLDEPFSALDAHLRFHIEQETGDIIRKYKKSVLLVSHDKDEVYRLSDRVALMNMGHIETVGEKSEVFNNPLTRNGALLTGCKNISRLKRLSEHRILATDWGIELEIKNDISDASYVGIRADGIFTQGSENRVYLKTKEIIENPFSLTVMSVKDEESAASPIAVEIPRDEWKEEYRQGLCVFLPSDRLLLLRD